MILKIPIYPEVKGVFVGGCVDRGEGSSFRAKAHAHTGESNRGWICVRSMKRLPPVMGDEIQGTNQLLIHEYAHIVTDQGHTDKWRAKMKELGGRISAWEYSQNSTRFARWYEKTYGYKWEKPKDRAKSRKQARLNAERRVKASKLAQKRLPPWALIALGIQDSPKSRTTGNRGEVM